MSPGFLLRPYGFRFGFRLVVGSFNARVYHVISREFLRLWVFSRLNTRRKIPIVCAVTQPAWVSYESCFLASWSPAKMVRITTPIESCNDPSRNERVRFLRFNMEHCEMYFYRAIQEHSDGVAVLLIDCTDTVGRAFAERLTSPARAAEVIADCERRRVIPTMHASVPMAAALGMLGCVSPTMRDAVARCPADCFPIWVIAAGGSSVAYRERPAMPVEFPQS